MKTASPLYSDLMLYGQRVFDRAKRQDLYASLPDADSERKGGGAELSSYTALEYLRAIDHAAEPGCRIFYFAGHGSMEPDIADYCFRDAYSENLLDALSKHRHLPVVFLDAAESKSESDRVDAKNQAWCYLNALKGATTTAPWLTSSPSSVIRWLEPKWQSGRANLWQSVARLARRLRDKDIASGAAVSEDEIRLFFSFGDTEETPAARAQRLIAWMESDAQQNKPLGDRCRTLARLAAGTQEVRDQLWRALREHGHPQLQWLAMEILAEHEWPQLAPWLVEELGRWDPERERAAVLGAVLTARRKKVPDELRPSLAEKLRRLLAQPAPGARDGAMPLQTEVLVHAIGAFAAFATAEDLRILQDLRRGVIFDVELTATKAITRVVARNAQSAHVEALIDAEGEALRADLWHYASKRNLLVENGTMLWTVASLLLARLGPEAECIGELGRAYSRLAPKLFKLAAEARTQARKLQRGVLHPRQQEVFTKLRQALDGSRKDAGAN